MFAKEFFGALERARAQREAHGSTKTGRRSIEELFGAWRPSRRLSVIFPTSLDADGGRLVDGFFGFLRRVVMGLLKGSSELGSKLEVR
jgi:hypothetical protein